MTSRQRWTLVATIIGSGAVFLDGTIVNVALPRIGQELPATLVGVLEGQTYVISGYLAMLAALLILAGALVGPLRPAPGLRHRLAGFARHLGAVRPGADARVAGRLPAPPGRGGRAARARLAVDHHAGVPGRQRGGRSDLGGGDLGADAPRSAAWAACWSTRSAGASPSWSMCRCWPSPCGRRSGTSAESEEDAKGRVRLARVARRGARRSAACRSA